MGRTPRPRALQLLNGRHDGVDSGGRKVPAKLGFRRLPPDKPTALSLAAGAHWDLIVPELMRLELIKPIDVGGLVILCETWALREQAMREIAALAESSDNAEGLTIVTAQGRIKNPAVTIAEKASSEYRAWATHFGLTPAAETKLKAREDDESGEDNPFA